MADKVIDSSTAEAGTEEQNKDQTQSTTDTTEDTSADGSTVDEVDYSTLEPEVRSVEDTAIEEDETDDSIDEDERKTLDSRIQKHLTPIQKQIQRQNNEIEVNAFLVENPELSKYKPAIMKYVEHPAYSKIPIAVIGAYISSKDQQKIGASKEREASRRAKETRSATSS